MYEAPASRPRARNLGIKIGIMSTGELNSICDVPGVKVGHVSLIEGEGPLVRNVGPIRTGVTAIIPTDNISPYKKLPAAVDVINGFGKSVGLMQMTELGELETPILLTNTLNVGKVSQYLVKWIIEQYPRIMSVNPVVMECNDSSLNDIHGMHVGREHVFEALKKADKNSSEGCIGAGVGMRSFGYKSGIGTASRQVKCGDKTYILGSLALNNMGAAGDLRIDGAPVGRMLMENQERQDEPPGSIIMIIATNAPMMPLYLRRVARRASFGLARTGGIASHGSGDIAVALTTVPVTDAHPENIETVRNRLTDFFRACVESVEEAIINSLLRANTVVGRDGNAAEVIPIEKITDIMASV